MTATNEPARPATGARVPGGPENVENPPDAEENDEATWFLTTRRKVWLQLDLLQKLTLTAEEAGWCGGPLCNEQLSRGQGQFCSAECHEASRAAWSEALAEVRALDPGGSDYLANVAIAGVVL